MRTLSLSTERHSQLVNITGEVRDAVAGQEGSAVLVYVPHTTAGVTINEHIDPALLTDMEDALERIADDGWTWRDDGKDGPNGPSHVRSTLVGSQGLIPLREGELALGTYQGIFFCEFDGPRRRSVHVSVLS